MVAAPTDGISLIGSAEDVSDMPARTSLRSTDDVLLALIAAGDQSALAGLFRRWVPVVRGIARRILKDTSEADDLVQDLFLFIRSKCAVFDGSKSSGGSWIVQMAYQRSIERRRRLASRQFYGRGDLESHAAQMVGNLTTEDDYSAETVLGRNGLEKIVRELSEHQRETLRLYFFEGYTLAEISLKTGQRLGNVRNHYYRALEKLRRQMFAPKV